MHFRFIARMNIQKWHEEQGCKNKRRIQMLLSLSQLAQPADGTIRTIRSNQQFTGFCVES